MSPAFFSILNNIGAAATVAFGLFGLFNPSSAAKLVGIVPVEPRGISDIRATYGGLFCGLGGYALYLHEPTAFALVGCGWLGAALARICSMITDQAFSRLNAGGLLLETCIALLLLV